jgi:hypothetical protein
VVIKQDISYHIFEFVNFQEHNLRITIKRKVNFQSFESVRLSAVDNFSSGSTK